MKQIVQFTGLSGAGKTTLSTLVCEALIAEDYRVSVLDGDAVRKASAGKLGFGKADRLEHLRNVAQLAAEADADIVLVAVINPYEESRAYFRRMGSDTLVWLTCDLEVLRSRDTKGLYARAFLPADHPDRLGNLTGVNDPYEHPTDADLIIDTGRETHAESAAKLIERIKAMALIK